MPIDVSIIVTTTRPAADSLHVTLPGGVQIAALPQMPVPDAGAMTRALLGQLNAALAPLTPALRLIDFALAAFETIQAIPAAFVDPSELIEQIEKLARSAGALASFIPAVSVPVLAGELVDVLIAYMEGLINEIQAIQALQAKIEAARVQAGTYPALSLVIAVSEADVAVHLESMNKGLGPVGTLIRVANVILSIAGISAVPSLDDLGADTTGAITALRDAVNALRTVRAALPV